MALEQSHGKSQPSFATLPAGELRSVEAAVGQLLAVRERRGRRPHRAKQRHHSSRTMMGPPTEESSLPRAAMTQSEATISVKIKRIAQP